MGRENTICVYGSGRQLLSEGKVASTSIEQKFSLLSGCAQKFVGDTNQRAAVTAGIILNMYGIYMALKCHVASKRNSLHLKFIQIILADLELMVTESFYTLYNLNLVCEIRLILKCL